MGTCLRFLFYIDANPKQVLGEQTEHPDCCAPFASVPADMAQAGVLDTCMQETNYAVADEKKGNLRLEISNLSRQASTSGTCNDKSSFPPPIGTSICFV